MPSVKLHRHIDGPFEDINDMWYNLCLVEHPNGDLLVEEITFLCFDDALEAKETLTTTLYVLEADVDGCSTTNLN